MALGHPSEIMNRRLPGLPTMADRKIESMEVGVLAHAVPALLSGEWGQEEGHGLPVLLGHDGGPGRRAEHIAVLLTPVLPPRVAGVERLQARLEQRTFVDRPDPVGREDREIVAAVLLAQPTGAIPGIVVR